MELLKELKYDEMGEYQADRNNCCQYSSEPVNHDFTSYTATNDCGEPGNVENIENTSSGSKDKKEGYHIKIAKVTIVYKVAYLRHYIKLRKGKSKLRKKVK